MTNNRDYDPRAIKAARIRAGLRQADLARAVGISRAHMCNIENGKVAGIGPNIIAAITKAVSCAVEDICPAAVMPRSSARTAEDACEAYEDAMRLLGFKEGVIANVQKLAERLMSASGS